MRVIDSLKRRLQDSKPMNLVIYGYVTYIVLGAILLLLPISQANPVSILDNLFVSTSAVSTTGLSPIDIDDDYTHVGQVVLLVLIQFGGIGYMTFSSFVILTSKKEMTDGRKHISRTVFSIPENFIIERFVTSVIVFTILIEAAGAVGLYFVFSSHGVENPLWSAIFHSISAFCTAGFSIYGSNLTEFRGDFWLNFIISALSFAGAIGFIVFVDLWRRIRGKQDRLSLTSMIIIRTTFWLVILGTILIFITETSLYDLPVWERIMASFFQVMTSLTTVGYNTIEIGALARSVLLLTAIFMIIGASPAGTGGGLKTTTFTTIIGLTRSVIRGKRTVTFWKANIPADRVRTAVATLGLYMTSLALGAYLLLMTEAGSAGVMDIFFEAASALGTVGLSTGLTSHLSVMGKLIIILLMFIGRVGPLTFGVAIFVKNKLIFDNKRTDLAI